MFMSNPCFRAAPGILASVVLTLVAYFLEYAQAQLIGGVWFDALVVAIVLGTVVHTAVGLPTQFTCGIHFSSKFLLEVAIVLLGGTISVSMIAGAGGTMIGLVIAIVLLSLVVSYLIARMLGLSDSLATLVACGNSICGNSAIVAAAPVIDAESQEVAASIAFTAALGILVVLLLPFVFRVLHLTEWQYGVIAGLTVYAVPQVLAATAPIGPVSSQIGTIVKLMRVLMLGPVILLLGIKKGVNGGRHLSLKHILPWFIIGFFVMMALRTIGVISEIAYAPIHTIAGVLTTISMAALGLSVNLKTVLASGGRVLMAGIFSIMSLATLSSVALMFLPR